jgi:hypothetical protein
MINGAQQQLTWWAMTNEDRFLLQASLLLHPDVEILYFIEFLEDVISVWKGTRPPKYVPCVGASRNWYLMIPAMLDRCHELYSILFNKRGY